MRYVIAAVALLVVLTVGLSDAPRSLFTPAANAKPTYARVRAAGSTDQLFRHGQLAHKVQYVLPGAHTQMLRYAQPVAVGGQDGGPAPYDYLLAGLGACTSMTIRMYADRKGWPLARVTVTLAHAKVHARDCAECETREGKIDVIDREILLDGPLDDDQRAKLMEIADKCPVHRTLHSEILVRTRAVTA